MPYRIRLFDQNSIKLVIVNIVQVNIIIVSTNPIANYTKYVNLRTRVKVNLDI